ncbi:MAG: glycosyltransferase [Ornithinimicrobium sp.]
MPEDTLLLRDGRAARVALLVYNDAHNDSRVLKTAASLRSAGADVRIFAVARGRAGYAEGPALVGDGIEVERAPEFELARYAPWALNLARRVAGRPVPPAATVGVAASSASASRGPAPTAPPGPGSRAPADGAGQRLVKDAWLRTYRVVSLSLFWWESARAAVAWEPDIVHANDGNTLAPAAWIAGASGARMIYDAHELWRHRNVRTDRPLAPLVEGAIEWWAIRRAAGVITVSPSIATWLQRTYDLPVRPTLVRNIPQGASDDAAAAPAGHLRSMAGLAPETQVIAYGGRITTSRGIEETVAALALLPSSIHFVLLGYGEPDYLATLHTRIESLGVTDRVHFVGAVASDQVSAALADADLSVVFVRPICLSYEFSLPNKLFESIHAGLPIAAADLPDTAAIVREHGVGEIFDVDHPDEIPSSMAATITAVLADPQRYRDATRMAAAELTWQHEERALLELYAQVVPR